MPDGVSLHIGVNQVDPSHYTGFDEHSDRQFGLRACESDAVHLQVTTAAQGFAASTLLGEAATVAAVATAIHDAAATLVEGDLFVLTFSGYGGGVPDRNSDDHWRERTWALYDRQVPEDELMSLVASFRPDVRVVVVDDSSEEGTALRALTFLGGGTLPLEEEPFRERALPPDVVTGTYDRYREVYDGIQSSCTPSDQAIIPAAVLIMTGFQKQRGKEGREHGVFTETLLRVWDGGRFDGNYEEFVEQIAARMPLDQAPRLTERGSGKPFVRQRALSI